MAVNAKKIKKTGQIVYSVGKADSGHTLVLVPFDRRAHSGNRGTIMTIRNENLVETHIDPTTL